MNLAYVAAGRLDAFWEEPLAPWDTAAGSLLVQESGGLVTDLTGQPYRIERPDVLATNGLLHPTILTAVLEARPIV
ncbi:MAG: hypothetical protein HY331_18200 [Chloroflexi bacterium]|nr:hypothetical protein [Chloroflexota bacterium]